MSNTREQLTISTVAIHWLVAFAIIGLIIFGLILEDMPRSPEKAQLIGLHKSLGLAALLLAFVRIFQRITNRFPGYAGEYATWEVLLSKITVLVLVLGTLMMPISGIMMSLGGGHPLPFFGLFEIGPMEKNEILQQIGKIGHGFGGKLMIGAIIVHFLGALKHHIIDKDGTMKRMAGRKVEVTEVA